MIVSCECGAKLKIDDAKVSSKGVKVRCPRCGNVIPVQKSSSESLVQTQERSEPKKVTEPASGPLVLVAHDSEVVRNMIAETLMNDGFKVDRAADGVEALSKAIENKPLGMVLDVGLPGIYGFVLCEKLKTNVSTSAIKIVLLSSVYDMRRYKRTPTNLYGADDYIEKHHIPDFLAGKLRKLIFPDQLESETSGGKEHSPKDLPEMSRPPAREFESSLLVPQNRVQAENVISDPLPSQSASQTPTTGGGGEDSALSPDSLSLDASIFQKEECDIPRVDEADPEAVEKARRFARIIVSDIALYNQDAVAEGLKQGTLYELLKTDINEGRELYEGRIPAFIRAKTDYFQEAFNNFIKSAQSQNVR